MKEQSSEQNRRINLTKHHYILIAINSLLILTFPLIHLIIKQTSNSLKENSEKILVIKKGRIHGGPGGEDVHNDAEIAGLKFNDIIMRVSATQTNDLDGIPMLLSLSFLYSNNKYGKEFGGINPPESWKRLNPLELNVNEHIIKITIYEDYRRILNPWRENKTTYFITGIEFETDYGQTILFGSSNGTLRKEAPKNYYLAYAQGKSGGIIDSFCFTWYKICSKNSRIFDET